MLAAGAVAPTFELTDVGGRSASLPELLRHGPALLAFFKITCPTCQFTFPYLDRMWRESGVPVIGISQDDEEGTEQFRSAFGVTFPTLIDPVESGYAVSNAYRLTHVPSLFLVEADGSISLAESGFSRAALETVAARWGGSAFRPDERVPEFKPG